MMIKRNQNTPASYLVLFKDNQVLLLKRFNTGYEDGKYSMIAGHVDAGESFSEAVIRESYEEAGIELNNENLQVFHIMHRKALDSERIDVFFIAKSWNGELKNKEPRKCSDLSWFDIDNIPENTIPYIKFAIQNIRNKIFYSEFGWKNMFRKK